MSLKDGAGSPVSTRGGRRKRDDGCGDLSTPTKPRRAIVGGVVLASPSAWVGNWRKRRGGGDGDVAELIGVGAFGGSSSPPPAPKNAADYTLDAPATAVSGSAGTNGVGRATATAAPRNEDGALAAATVACATVGSHPVSAAARRSPYAIGKSAVDVDDTDALGIIAGGPPPPSATTSTANAEVAVARGLAASVGRGHDDGGNRRNGLVAHTVDAFSDCECGHVREMGPADTAENGYPLGEEKGAAVTKNSASEDCHRPAQARAEKENGSNSSPFDSLPAEIMGAVLRYAGVPSQLHLASCSKHWEDFIYVQSTWLWAEVDFGKLPRTCAARICDQSLRRLLERINAREVTKVLLLRGCTGITGAGLEALRSSPVLEEIDLRIGDDHDVTFGETGLDNLAVLDVLSTMVPGPRCTRSRPMTFGATKLSIVKFRRQFDSTIPSRRYSSEILNWMVRHREQVNKALMVNRVKCGHCQSVMAENIAKEGLRGDFLCVSCRRYSCNQGRCPPIFECDACAGQHCFECRMTSICDVCDLFFCWECRYVATCRDCSESICGDCGDMKWFDCCEESFCDGLRRRHTL